MLWTLLIISLPTENATARMRAWRALKALGAAVLRDGVYLLPARDEGRTALQEIAVDVQKHGGSAHLLQARGDDDQGFAQLFDRSQEFGELMVEVAAAHGALSADNALDALKRARKLRRSFAQLVAIDFFPGEACKQADAALLDLEAATQTAMSPDEPHPVSGPIPRLRMADYQRRVWATRQRPWVDRLACAWLIRRFIDPAAKILWLADAKDCPRKALGFDFDGATFTHSSTKVSFETLLASFGLDAPALQRLGALVHFLDVGGVQPSEASGVERVLAGLREAIIDDDQLLAAATGVFNGLLTAFERELAA